MENIKVGDYAKHTKDGYIGKIVDFDDTFVRLDIGRSALRHYIKTAESILDLIQEGDYVNGEEVINTCYEDKVETDKSYFTEEIIKSIVTKEQFTQMEYKVGE